MPDDLPLDAGDGGSGNGGDCNDDDEGDSIESFARDKGWTDGWG